MLHTRPKSVFSKGVGMFLREISIFRFFKKSKNIFLEFVIPWSVLESTDRTAGHVFIKQLTTTETRDGEKLIVTIPVT